MRPLPSRLLIAAVLGLAVVAGACSSGSSSAGSSSADGSAKSDGGAKSSGKPADGRRGPTSGEEAVKALLTAEVAGDHERSFELLSDVDREQIADAADWARVRDSLPAVTGFRIEKADKTKVVTIVEHAPGLDPFVGLSLAQERQVWRVRQVDGRWAVDPAPTVEPILPDLGKAPAAALAWSKAVQRCDATAAMEVQADQELYGSSEGADRLCKSTGAVSAGKAKKIPPGPRVADLVSQYGGDVFIWARAVSITGGPVAFGVILAPIGNDWRVLGVYDA